LLLCSLCSCSPMGKAGKKRLRDEVEAPPITKGPLHSSLEALPRPSLLELRRDLALGPFDEALRRLSDSGRCERASSEATCEALREAGEEASVEALAAVLGLKSHCWGFSKNAEAVDAACHALKVLLQPDKVALLEALKQGAAFCASVKRQTACHVASWHQLCCIALEQNLTNLRRWDRTMPFQQVMVAIAVSDGASGNAKRTRPRKREAVRKMLHHRVVRQVKVMMTTLAKARRIPAIKMRRIRPRSPSCRRCATSVN